MPLQWCIMSWFWTWFENRSGWFQEITMPRTCFWAKSAINLFLEWICITFSLSCLSFPFCLHITFLRISLYISFPPALLSISPFRNLSESVLKKSHLHVQVLCISFLSALLSITSLRLIASVTYLTSFFPPLLSHSESLIYI